MSDTTFSTQSHGTIAPTQTFAELGTVTHDGRAFSSGGASISDDRLVAYLSADAVTTWDGQPIGQYHIAKTWRCPIRSRWGMVGSYRMSQVSITLADGRRYQGRSQGVGMIVTARRVKGQGK